MNESTFLKTRIYFTAIVSIAIWSLLAWNHFHGGVPGHNILAREDMPFISNWWGGLLLPLLTWFLLYRIQKRLGHNHSEDSNASAILIKVVYGFAGALLFGIVLSTSFTLGYAAIPRYMVNSIFVIALFFPIYRAECLLGFVIGMTFTFGAVLPTGIGSIFALIGAMLYLLVRPAILFVASRFMRLVSSDKQ